MSKILIFGLGDAGMKLAINVYKEAYNHHLTDESEFFVADVYPIRKNMNLRTEARRIDDLLESVLDGDTIKMFGAKKELNEIVIKDDTDKIRVIGNEWILSLEFGKRFLETQNRNFDKIIELSKSPYPFLWVNIINSGCGGTGNGCGPLFMDKIKEKTNGRNLFLTNTVVLPYEGNSIEDDANSICNIIRDTSSCDSVILIDNQYIHNKRQTKIKKSAEELVNEMFGKWMANLINHDISEIRNTLTSKKGMEIVVPSYSEYSKEEWKTLHLNVLTTSGIINGMLGEINVEKAMLLYVCVTIPRYYGNENINVKELEEFVADEMKTDAKIKTGTHEYDEIKISTFIISSMPHSSIPRLKKLKEKLQTLTNDRGKLMNIADVCKDAGLEISFDDVSDIYRGIKNKADEIFK